MRVAARATLTILPHPGSRFACWRRRWRRRRAAQPRRMPAASRSSSTHAPEQQSRVRKLLSRLFGKAKTEQARDHGLGGRVGPEGKVGVAREAAGAARRQGHQAARGLEPHPDAPQEGRAPLTPEQKAAVDKASKSPETVQRRRAQDARRGGGRAGADAVRAERRHQGPGRTAGGPLRQGGAADERRRLHHARPQAAAGFHAGRRHLGRRDRGDRRARRAHAVEGRPPVGLLRLQGPRLHGQARGRRRPRHGRDRPAQAAARPRPRPGAAQSVRGAAPRAGHAAAGAARARGGAVPRCRAPGAGGQADRHRCHAALHQEGGQHATSATPPICWRSRSSRPTRRSATAASATSACGSCTAS